MTGKVLNAGCVEVLLPVQKTLTMLHTSARSSDMERKLHFQLLNRSEKSESFKPSSYRKLERRETEESIMEHNRFRTEAQNSIANRENKKGVDNSVDQGKDLIVYSDGASRSNPGLAGVGAAIQNAQGQTLERLYRYLGNNLTNNVAEYEAAIMGLERAVELGADTITLKADSELVIRQLRGEYRVKSEELKPLHQHATQLLKQFDRFKLEHIPRSLNQEADALANRAIDEWRSLNDQVCQTNPVREVVVNHKVSLVVGAAEQLELPHTPQTEQFSSRQSQPQLSRRIQRSRQFEL
jgi:ribonuclease HI